MVPGLYFLPPQVNADAPGHPPQLAFVNLRPPPSDGVWSAPRVRGAGAMLAARMGDASAVRTPRDLGLPYMCWNDRTRGVTMLFGPDDPLYLFPVGTDF